VILTLLAFSPSVSTVTNVLKTPHIVQTLGSGILFALLASPTTIVILGRGLFVICPQGCLHQVIVLFLHAAMENVVQSLHLIVPILVYTMLLAINVSTTTIVDFGRRPLRVLQYLVLAV
jgi:hypothetical protein